MLTFEELLIKYQVTKSDVAKILGFSKAYIRKLENTGKIDSYCEEIEKALTVNFEKNKNRQNLECKIDYLKISFKTKKWVDIVKYVLKLEDKPFLKEDKGSVGYNKKATFQYITIFYNDTENVDMGCLVEMKGEGCRQFEWYLENEQNATWKEFLGRCFDFESRFIPSYVKNGMNFPRIDIALDEKYQEGKNFNIADFAMLKKKELLDTKLGVRIISKEVDSEHTATTVYFGSQKSTFHFCFYEKDLEQTEKQGVSVGYARNILGLKNRYEVRLKDKVAKDFITRIVSGEDVAILTVSIINGKLKVYEKKNKGVQLNRKWYEVMGSVDKETFVTAPKEIDYFFKQKEWVRNSVAPTTTAIFEFEKGTGGDTKSFVESLIHTDLSYEQEKRLLYNLELYHAEK